MAQDFTQRLLLDAGIREGMTVLDAGCGSGDVSFLLAELVGEKGQVVGFDHDARPLETVRERAAAQGLSHLHFVQGGFDAFAAEPASFDAVVGRRVLMYQPDATEALRQLWQALRPGGLAVFQEHDSAIIDAGANLPLHQQVRGWIWETVRREGADIHMGLGLSTALTQAGFAVGGVRAEAVVVTPAMAHPAAAIVRAMLPRITGLKVVSEKEIGLETLEQRLNDERVQADSTYVWELVFGAWGRKGTDLA